MGSVGGYWNIGSSGGYYSKGSVRSNGLVAYFNQGGIGDTVRVMETRPLSKDKRWRLVEIIEKAR